MRIRTIRPWLRLIAKRAKTQGRRPKRPSERGAGCRFFLSPSEEGNSGSDCRSAIFNSRSLFLVSRTLRDTTTTTVQKKIFPGEHFLLFAELDEACSILQIVPLFHSPHSFWQEGGVDGPRGVRSRQITSIPRSVNPFLTRPSLGEAIRW